MDGRGRPDAELTLPRVVEAFRARLRGGVLLVVLAPRRLRAAAAAASASLARVPLALDVTYARGPNFPFASTCSIAAMNASTPTGPLHRLAAARTSAVICCSGRRLCAAAFAEEEAAAAGVPSPEANDGSPQRLAALWSALGGGAGLLVCAGVAKGPPPGVPTTLPGDAGSFPARLDSASLPRSTALRSTRPVSSRSRAANIFLNVLRLSAPARPSLLLEVFAAATSSRSLWSSRMRMSSRLSSNSCRAAYSSSWMGRSLGAREISGGRPTLGLPRSPYMAFSRRSFWSVDNTAYAWRRSTTSSGFTLGGMSSPVRSSKRPSLCALGWNVFSAGRHSLSSSARICRRFASKYSCSWWLRPRSRRASTRLRIIVLLLPLIFGRNVHSPSSFFSMSFLIFANATNFSAYPP